MSFKPLRTLIISVLIGGIMMVSLASFSLAQKAPKGTLAIKEILVNPQEVVQGESVEVTIKCTYSAPQGIKFGQWICLIGVLVYDSDGILVEGDEYKYKRWEEYKRGVVPYECGEDGESGVFTYSFSLATEGLSPGNYSYNFKIYGSQRTTGLGQPYWVIYHFTDKGTFSFTVKPPISPPSQEKPLTKAETEEPPDIAPPPPPDEFPDRLVIADSFPSNGGRVKLEYGEKFRAVVNFNLSSTEIATIKTQVIADLGSEGERIVCERAVMVNKGYDKTLEIGLPSSLPPTTERIVISARLISSEGGKVIASDEITAYPWVPTNVVLIPLDKPVVANGRGFYVLKVKLTQNDQPVEGARVEIWPQPSPHTFLTDGLINQNQTIVALTTNAAGEVAFKFTPPRLIGKKSIRDIQEKELFYPILVKTPGLAEDKVFKVQLTPPHPRIKSVRVSELSSGDWQKTSSIIEVDDPDSNRFNGDIGWKGGHQNFKKLVAQGEKIFYFRLKPKKFGLDLQDLPDLSRKLLKANAEFITSTIKQYWIKNDELHSLRDLVFDFKKQMEGVAKSAEKIGKESVAVKDRSQAYYLTIEGYNTTVGVVDYINSVLDYLRRKPVTFNPGEVAVRLVYENAKVFYEVFEAHRRVAEAVEDVVFFPILVQVKDEEGYWDSQLRQVSVRFWKR
jgi:hypothetical protein